MGLAKIQSGSDSQRHDRESKTDDGAEVDAPPVMIRETPSELHPDQDRIRYGEARERTEARKLVEPTVF